MALQSFSVTNYEHLFTAHISNADGMQFASITNDLPLIDNQRSENKNV